MESTAHKPRPTRRLKWPQVLLQPIWRSLALVLGFGLYLAFTEDPSVAVLGGLCAILLLYNPQYVLTTRHTPHAPQRGNRSPLQHASSGTLNDINREPLPLLPELSAIPPRFQALIRILGRPLPFPGLSAALRITDRFLVPLQFLFFLPLQIWFVASGSTSTIPYILLVAFILMAICLTRRQYRRLYDAYDLGSEPRSTTALAL